MFLIWFELIGAKAVLPPSEMIFLPTNLFLDHLCSQLDPAAGAHSTFGHDKGVLPKNGECNSLTKKLFIKIFLVWFSLISLEGLKNKCRLESISRDLMTLNWLNVVQCVISGIILERI